MKNLNEELAQEKKFMDEQILRAKSNQEKLLRNLDALKIEYENILQEENENLEDLDLRASHGAEDKSLEVTNVLGMTEIKHSDEQKSIDHISDKSKALVDPNHSSNTGRMEIYDSRLVDEKERQTMEQEAYFQLVQKRFQEKIKLLKKKVEFKRKKEMKALKFI
jgi:hypothetical protein